MYKVWHFSLKNVSSVFVSLGNSKDSTKKKLIRGKQAWLLLFWTHVGQTLFFPIYHSRKKDVNEQCT